MGSGLWLEVFGGPVSLAVSHSVLCSLEGEDCGLRSPGCRGGNLAGPQQLIPNLGREKLSRGTHFRAPGPRAFLPPPAKLLSPAGWDNLSVIRALDGFSVSSGRIGEISSLPT